MKVRGTVHLIHQEDNQWIFKFELEGKPQRLPFVFYSGKYEDGQELDCYLETVGGVERAKPLQTLPIDLG
jgi:hypothetical protein